MVCEDGGAGAGEGVTRMPGNPPPRINMKTDTTSEKQMITDLPDVAGCLQQICSAATIREALQRCATMDDGWARSALNDAEQCEKSDHPAIRARAHDLRSRAENSKLAAARYRSALNWLVG